MKIKYHFNTETIEIEVSEEWGEILVELDRQEYNINHKETRRHTSLDAMKYEGEIFASNTNIAAEYIRTQENETLLKAIDSLLPQQKELVRRVYFNNESLASIAREEGVSKMAITNRMKKIHEKLKKNFELGGLLLLFSWPNSEGQNISPKKDEVKRAYETQTQNQYLG